MKPIIYWEGWLQSRNAYIASMIDSLKLKGTGYTSHASITLPESPVILMGHSLGAHQALKHARPGDTVITLDPRWQSPASYFDFLIPFQKPFTAPKGVKVYNFFRHGFLPGYPVTGAVVNKNLGPFVLHQFVPKAAAQEVGRILKEVR